MPEIGAIYSRSIFSNVFLKLMFEIFLKIIVAFNIYKLKNGQGVHHPSIKDSQRIKVVPQSRMSLFPILILIESHTPYATCIRIGICMR